MKQIQFGCFYIFRTPTANGSVIQGDLHKKNKCQFLFIILTVNAIEELLRSKLHGRKNAERECSIFSI